MFDLAAMTRRQRNIRRPSIKIRDIAPPAVMASDLYRACYAPVVQVWSRAAERVITEYGRTLALTTDAPSDLRHVLDAAAAEFERLFLLLRPRLTDWLVRTERWQRGKWRGAVLSATGVDLQTLIGPEDVRETLESYLEWNVALVRDVSAQAQKRISDAIFDGLTNRTPVRDVAAKVREASAMSRRRSIGIASDQLSKVTSALASERRREAGIERWEWVHSGKLHPREDHKARNGKVYSDADAPKDLPGRLPYCGCRERAVLDFG